jgi:hypothetical protein
MSTRRKVVMVLIAGGLVVVLVAASVLVSRAGSGRRTAERTARPTTTASPTPSASATPTPTVLAAATAAPRASAAAASRVAAPSSLCGPITRINAPSAASGTPWKRDVVASTFYIGEAAGPSNANISNVSLAWDDTGAVAHFGGVDRWDPAAGVKRNGLCPQGFTPKQNPFYVALPVPDHGDRGVMPEAVPWVAAAAQYLPELRRFPGGAFGENDAPFKNLWVEITYNGRSAYAQIEDVGPSDDQGETAADYAAVLGPEAHPVIKNSFGLKALIDLSPAASDYLGTGGDARVSFRLVPASLVPPGPWKLVPTTAGPTWR